MSDFPGFIHRGILPRPFTSGALSRSDWSGDGPDPCPTRSRDFLADPTATETYPVTVWDGVTTVTIPAEGLFGNGTFGPYLPGMEVPTSVAGKLVETVGTNTDYALKLTPAEFATVFWRIQEITLTLREFSASASAGELSITSGHWEDPAPDAPPGTPPTWVEDSGSVAASAASLDGAPYDLTVAGEDSHPIRLTRRIQESDPLIERRLLDGGPAFQALALGSDDAELEFLPALEDQDSHFVEGDASVGGSTEAAVNFTGYQIGAFASQWLAWPIGSNDVVPFHFVDGNFWLPLPTAFEWGARTDAAAEFAEQGGEDYAIISHAPDVTTAQRFSTGFNADPLWYAAQAGAPLPAMAESSERLILEFAFSPTHVVTAEFLTFKQSVEVTAVGDGAPDGATSDIAIARPVVRVTPKTYFTYGGRYDEATGARV